ncbi:MAG: hypothetical protein R8J84_06630 [Mariprofundales bacterium]
MKWWMLFFLPLLFSACGEEESGWHAPPQQWQDLILRIETRPPQLVTGMNEFLVIANRQQRGFVNDLVVHFRTTSSEWRQAMPDGALGVYRRALPVRDLLHDQLFVRLDKKGQHGELTFPLAPPVQP